MAIGRRTKKKARKPRARQNAAGTTTPPPPPSPPQTSDLNVDPWEVLQMKKLFVTPSTLIDFGRDGYLTVRNDGTRAIYVKMDTGGGMYVDRGKQSDIKITQLQMAYRAGSSVRVTFTFGADGNFNGEEHHLDIPAASSKGAYTSKVFYEEGVKKLEVTSSIPGGFLQTHAWTRFEVRDDAKWIKLLPPQTKFELDTHGYFCNSFTRSHSCLKSPIAYLKGVQKGLSIPIFQ